tara:strand:+ start:41 stop:424 length:384 start_codon:yes stop_codon:yes gene_type:complete
MKIKDHRIEELREFACDLMSKTYLELGQRPSEEDVFTFAVILADDLKIDFGNLELQDIQQAFRQGIRNTKEFHLTVKVYYKWIKSHRQVIWDNETKQPEQRDKRLRYRSRKGTGMKQISINKLKQLK